MLFGVGHLAHRWLLGHDLRQRVDALLVVLLPLRVVDLHVGDQLWHVDEACKGRKTLVTALQDLPRGTHSPMRASCPV